MNKVVNPLVHLILRSPFHRIMSATLLLITYHGRKSGKEYTLPVQYVQEDRTIYIISGTPEKKTWWRNLRRGTKVQLWLGDKSMTGEAVVLEGNAEAEAITQALDLYLRRFPAAARTRSIHLEKDGSFNRDDVRQAASATVVVRIELNH